MKRINNFNGLKIKSVEKLLGDTNFIDILPRVLIKIWNNCCKIEYSVLIIN